jgi:hypothetical protein
MRLRDIIICLLCLLIAVGLLLFAGEKLDYINAARKEMMLVINEPLENAPPSLAFATIAMGAFRGLVVDILWIRAERLKEQGQFFDAKQLAEWITVLQPRFISVWDFHAWNMAYNISVAIPASEPEQRWQWVKNGYELLRDKAIVINPKSILLYRSLAWIFQHKMGGISDDDHKYYKLQLALAMRPLLGPQTNEFFQALADAPQDWAGIMKDPSVGRLVDGLKAADPTFEDRDKFVGNYLTLRSTPAKYKPEAFDVIDQFRGTAALEKFDIFAKAYELRHTWKLEPAFMQQLNQAYGPPDITEPNVRYPLNWEHPDVHAIYWAAMGLKIARREELSIDEVNTDRIVYHSLQNLFRAGKIFIYESPVVVKDSTGSTEDGETSRVVKTVFIRPDLRMFEPYEEAMFAVIEKYKKLGRDVTSHEVAHRNMMVNAVFSFYQAGHIAKAQQIYNRLGKLYPRDEFRVPLVVFVRNRLREELKEIGIKDATEMVMLLLREAYFRYALRDDDEAFGREKMAREIFEHYSEKFSDESTERLELPDFAMLRYLALDGFLRDEMYPPRLRQNLLGRIKIERPDLFEQLEAQRRLLLQ